MNQFIQKMERKFGRHAVPHLTYILIGCYVVGYLLQMSVPSIIQFMCLDPHAILHGQIWRLLTWIIIPPSRLSIFTVIMLLFYLSIGTSLERVWGDFQYNVYVIGGLLISVLAAFLSYAVFCALHYPAALTGAWIGQQAFTTYYICMSLLLAYAATFPDATVLLMFVIPIRMKYLGIVYGAFIGYDVISLIRFAANGGEYGFYWLNVIAILASVVNFAVFFFLSRQRVHLSREQKKRQQDFRKAVNRAEGGRKMKAAPARGKDPEEKITQVRPYRHRCTICGRTDLSDPDMEFRYCSKCAGAHEYCSEHLYTHVHITAEGSK